MLFFEGSSSTSHGRKQDPLLIKMQESAAKPNNSHDFFFFFLKCTVAVLVTKQCSTHMSSCHACILIYSYAELMLSNLC